MVDYSIMMKKLEDKIREKDAPVVVGLDPTLAMVPDRITQAAYRVYGMTAEGAGQALFAFNREIIDATADLVPAFKLQIAMYEMYGIPGLCAYRDTIDYCHEKGLIVIGDIKRGDIGSTAGAYAAAHLGLVSVDEEKVAPFDTDFVTVNPYLGTDGVQPFIDACRAYDKGMFVLVKTSNPSGKELQDLVTEDGRTVYEHLAQMVNDWGKDVTDGTFSRVGAVVGATQPQTGRRLRELMPDTMFLLPGYGAQGATAKDIKPFFRKDGTGVIVNSSRGIITAWQSERYERFADAPGDAAREAVSDMKRDLEQVR